MNPNSLFITAVPEEMEAVRAHLYDRSEQTEPRTKTLFATGKFKAADCTSEIFIAEVGKGNASAASVTSVGLFAIEPDVEFLIGVAGGCKDVAKGDVVVADKVYHYETGAEGDVQAPPEFRTTIVSIGSAGEIGKQKPRVA